MAGLRPSGELQLRTVSGLVIAAGVIAGIYFGGWAWLLGLLEPPRP